MEAETKVEAFVKGEMSRANRNAFIFKILFVSIGYTGISFFLNSIRATASLWIVWPLIIIQFALYFSIFILGYYRSRQLGFNKTAGLILFVALACLGRVNDWELLIIPLVVVAMLVFSFTKK